MWQPTKRLLLPEERLLHVRPAGPGTASVLSGPALTRFASTAATPDLGILVSGNPFPPLVFLLIYGGRLPSYCLSVRVNRVKSTLWLVAPKRYWSLLGGEVLSRKKAQISGGSRTAYRAKGVAKVGDGDGAIRGTNGGAKSETGIVAGATTLFKFSCVVHLSC